MTSSRNARGRRLLVLLLAGVTLALACCSTTPSTAGARFIPTLNKVAGDKGEVFREGCHVGRARARSGPCRFGDVTSKKTVVLFGDSRAMQWGPGLIKLARQRSWQIVALTRASCPAALVDIDHYCNVWRRNSLKRIREMRPGLIVVSSAANYQGYRVSGMSRTSSEPHLVRGMVRSLRRLRSWSIKTVVIRDQAVTPFSVTACLRRNKVKTSICGFRPYRPWRFAYDYKATRRVKGVSIIDPMKVMCKPSWCRPVDHEHLIYRNHGHLAASFTRFRSDWLGEQLGDPWATQGEN